MDKATLIGLFRSLHMDNKSITWVPCRTFFDGYETYGIPSEIVMSISFPEWNRKQVCEMIDEIEKRGGKKIIYGMPLMIPTEKFILSKGTKIYEILLEEGVLSDTYPVSTFHFLRGLRHSRILSI